MDCRVKPGNDEIEFILATHPRPSFAKPFPRKTKRGASSNKREAERRKAHCPTMSAPTDKSAKLVCARLRAVRHAAFRRSRSRHSPPATTPMAQLQNRVSHGAPRSGHFSRFASKRYRG